MLKRDISTTNLLIAAAGSMVGSGWLFSPFICAQMAGSNALISWVLGAVFMLFIALPLCELGTMFPVSGGIANYPSFTHGKEVGFLFAWVTWLSYVVMVPIEIQAIMQYTNNFIPILVKSQASGFELSGYGYGAAISIMLFVVLLNTFGIKLLVECNKYASILKFVLPGLAIASLIYTAPTLDNLKIENLSDSKSWVHIFSALSSGGIIFAFIGFQNGLMLAGEVKNPQRNIPIAVLGAILLGFVLYFMLQLAFIIAVPGKYLAQGWSHLSFPGDSGPLVGLTVLLGLGVIARLLMFDAALSPLGTTLVYTAATSRILFGMAENNHLPKYFLKLNRYKIPYIALIVNFLVGTLAFLPFPGWQKMMAFLSSVTVLSYGVGPICLLAMRKLRPNQPRPFYLMAGAFFCHVAFFMCNLMLYWCGFAVIWKLCVALLVGLVLHHVYQKKWFKLHDPGLAWFIFYMGILFLISYAGSFDGGIGLVLFPYDTVLILILSYVTLTLSQFCMSKRAEVVLDDDNLAISQA